MAPKNEESFGRMFLGCFGPIKKPISPGCAKDYSMSQIGVLPWDYWGNQGWTLHLFQSNCCCCVLLKWAPHAAPDPGIPPQSPPEVQKHKIILARVYEIWKSRVIDGLSRGLFPFITSGFPKLWSIQVAFVEWHVTQRYWMRGTYNQF